MKQLLRAVLWIVCWGGVCWAGIKAKLGFDILEAKDWEMLFDHSPKQKWPLDKAPKKLVCKVLLGFIVIGVLGIAIALKRKKKHVPIVVEERHQSNDTFRPAPMASQGRMMSSTPTPASAPAYVPPDAPVNTQPAGVTAAPPVSPALSATGTMQEALKRISDLAGNFLLTAFPHVKLENTFTQMVLSDDIIALMLKVLPHVGTWQVQEAADPAESIWTLDNREGQNAIKDIIQSAQTLKKLEPEANVVPLVILTNGNIQEPEKIRQYLEQNNIRIATLLPNSGEIPGIQQLEEVLGEFFERKSGGES